MIKSLTVTLLAVTTLSLTTGCSFFKKSNRSKESTAIASDVEETFRRRWVDKRAGEIAARGVAPEAARTQAENEFRERFDFSKPKK